MKTMTCRQLGGACDKEFRADTFDDMAELSKKHGMEMWEKKDPDHMAAMAQMKDLMDDPKAMQAWMEERHKEFEGLPDDD